jgi:peptide chain release factor 2
MSSALLDKLIALEERHGLAVVALGLEASRARALELEGDMNDPGFWNDQNAARILSQELAELNREVGLWDKMKSDLAEAKDIAAFAEGGTAEDKAEAERIVVELERRFAAMEFHMFFSGEYDSRNAILSFHAGAGGTDANDWVAMLLRMMTRFAERQGFTVDILDESRGEEAGYKSVTIAVRGRHAYGYLRSEAGVHRLVRISPFDGEKMRHTTFALIEVLPEFDDVDAASVDLDMDDVRIDTFLSSGKGGQSVNTTYSAVRVTHEPTGISVSCQNERSQLQNKETALNVLRAKLLQLMVTARLEKLSDIKGEHKTAAWGNQIRSYVLHPYKMVKDHRTESETSDTEAVLDGDILSFIEAYLRHDAEKRNA